MFGELVEVICNYVEVEPEAVKPESRFMVQRFGTGGVF